MSGTNSSVSQIIESSGTRTTVGARKLPRPRSPSVRRVPPHSTSPVSRASATTWLVALDRRDVDDRRQEAVALERADPRDRLGAGHETVAELVDQRLVRRTPARRPSTSGRRTRTRERAVPSTASARSADAATITGFLPPISQIAGRGCDDEKDWMIDIPTPLEPVNVRPPSRLSPTSAAPAWSPAPVTRLTAPGGTPPSTNASYIEVSAQRADLGRLDDDRVAGDERGARRAGDERRRVVERRDHAPDAVRPHHVASSPRLR